MMKKGCLLLCATALSLAWLDNQAQASIGFNLKAPPVPSYAKLHTSHTSHLMARHLSSPSFSERPEVKVAQVCFITDTEDCGGADFVGTDRDPTTPSGGGGGGDDDGDDYKESCAQMGYTLSSCQSGYKGYKFCPLDNKYFAECIPDCPSSYVTCEAPLKGVGTVCGNGLYSDCCNPSCSAEYKYALGSIPDGYEADGEPCKSCDGDLYKIKERDCSGFLDCSLTAPLKGALTCLSGNITRYSACEPCPNLGTESECPPCSVCTFEKCSNLYIVTGCATGCTDWCDYCAFEQ